MLDIELNETQLEIKRWLDRLDEFVVAKEAEWGIGNLEKLCSAMTAEKIKRQDKKLADAIRSQDIRLVQDLARGYMKGVEVMEKEALKAGHKKITPEYMEVQLDDGFTLRIAKTATESRACTEQGVYVWSLEEVARVIASEYTLVNKIKDTFPNALMAEVKKKDEFDFDKGDDVPEF